MSHLLFLQKDIDIRQYPTQKNAEIAKNYSSVTIGDLHGNALKLIYFLIDQGILISSKEDFVDIVSIYLIAENVYNLKAEHLIKYNDIVSKMEVNPKIHVRFLGDVLCDRGSNDYFTLKILEKIITQNLSIEILLSNHDCDFIEAFEKEQSFDCFRLQPIHAMSMQDLQILINNQLIKREEIVRIYQQCYQPFLKCISYDKINDNEMVFYSHAAIDLSIVAAMSKAFNLTYQDQSTTELAQSISAINEIFFNEYVKKNKVHFLLNQKEMWKGYEGDEINGLMYPFVFVIWNRNYADLNRPEQHQGYQIRYCHGHDYGEGTRANIYNLDNMLGKIRGGYYQGDYTLLYCSDSFHLQI